MMSHTNGTLYAYSWFPYDDEEGTLMKRIQRIKLTLYGVFFAVIFSIFLLVTITLYQGRMDIKPNKRKNESLIKAFLKSEMAVPLIIYLNLIAAFSSAICGFGAELSTSNTAECTAWQRAAGGCYMTTLWATYVLFVARSMTIGGSFKGWKGWVVFWVHIGTAATPFGSLGGYWAVSGTYYEEACIQSVNSGASIVLILTDTSLSAVSKQT
jgi:hypothetical protein